MAIMNSCNKHNMIACVEKTERNADFHESTAKVRMINDVGHIKAKVAGKKILVSEASVRTDLMFNDEDDTNCFDNQVIWDTLRDIGYEGSLTLLSFSKPLFSPQWKYLIHTLLHCLSSKSSSWDQFGTNIASALVGLATNQRFNFSKLIFDGMIRNLKDSKPFLMYPRFIQLFLNKQLEVATAVRDEHLLHTEELDITTSSHHSDDSSAGEKAKSPSPVASKRAASPNDYTPTDEVQTSGGVEGHLDLHGLTRELKHTLSKKKKLKKAHKQKSSSFKQGRKKVSDGSTGLNEVDVNSWEIIRWRLYESTGVHILELENGTMVHMLAEQRYPLTRELMQRMLEHKLEVQRETEDALNLIRFVMKQKEDLEREEE
ncbi:hypothetical protein Tco_0867100 [Tanacetum coccineum]